MLPTFHCKIKSKGKKRRYYDIPGVLTNATGKEYVSKENNSCRCHDPYLENQSKMTEKLSELSRVLR